MELLFIPSLLFTLFILQVNAVGSADVVKQKKLEITPQSCLDYLKQGYTSDDFYKIYDCNSRKMITVYCDMTSEPGSAWTLVMSFALKNKVIEQLSKKGFQQNAPVNENSPNFDLYRMSNSQMTYLKSQSTHWRVTCEYPKIKVDYRDYVRAKFTDFDLMTFTGFGICKKVEYVNIRGHQCAYCTSKWWQLLNRYAPHIDSTIAGGCQFDASAGAVRYEDDFGYYTTPNKKFRCTTSDLSTTNWWFGAYI
ncbi:uncharacterized protein LOC124441386 [Xenia sp. Carnegie-2017]|uniref:uncharacterized protein LOC124441386 n=1 Tax=Xenia sp. Carnegie-2017 TaxID=2897299 RepID=UPI001F04DFDC|nr:uncharacterized protein LOC124441386 [Xenia sp. Carnegie-2017]